MCVYSNYTLTRWFSKVNPELKWVFRLGMTGANRNVQSPQVNIVFMYYIQEEPARA